MPVMTAKDAMRDRFATARAGDSLKTAALAIREFRRIQPDADVCAVFEGGDYIGLLGHFAILRELGREALGDSLRLSVGPADFEETFRGECAKALERPAGRAADRDVPKVSPAEPLFLVRGAMLRSGRPFAAVVDAGRLLGLVTAGDALMALRLDADAAL